jgi:serine phosphatase RsbU (regulator of sigma subunit)
VIDAGVEPAEPSAHDRSSLLLSSAERERLERLLRLLAHVFDTGAAGPVAEVLAEGGCLLAGARVGWVVLRDDQTVVTSGPDSGWIDAAIAPQQWAIVRDALAGEVVHVGEGSSNGRPDPAGEERELPAVLTADGRTLRSFLATPVPARDGDVLGVLVLAHHRARAFSARHVGLVDALCAHLGHALEMCDSVAAQTRIATALQETLLPPVLPWIGGAQVSACYRPSGSGNLVGGDFYDVFSDGAEGWYVLVGDASGVGPEVAGLAGVVRYTARALAETAGSPAEMLRHINLQLLRAAPEDRFCTAVLARLVPRRNGTVAVEFASGGHPPPFTVRASGEVAPAMAPTGTILGVLADAPVGYGKEVLHRGDAVVFYTDGVVEAQNSDGEQFGEERLTGVLADARGRSASGIARRVEQAVVDFRVDGSHDDDLAIVVVRCSPKVDAGTGPP